MSSIKKRSIYIVDDHPVFRKGLSHLINEENDLEVIGESEEVFSAKISIAKLQPDLVIVDITLKDTSGIELIKHLHDHYPSMPTMVISMHDEKIYAERVLKAGARGYVMKQEMTDKITTAIRHVLNGKIYTSAQMTEIMLEEFLDKNDHNNRNPIELLTDRELEIFQLIGRGFKRKEIAEKLNLNVNTIGTYRERIKEKLRLASPTELVTQAYLWVQNEQTEN